MTAPAPSAARSRAAPTSGGEAWRAASASPPTRKASQRTATAAKRRQRRELVEVGGDQPDQSDPDEAAAEVEQDAPHAEAGVVLGAVAGRDACGLVLTDEALRGPVGELGAQPGELLRRRPVASRGRVLMTRCRSWAHRGRPRLGCPEYIDPYVGCRWAGGTPGVARRVQVGLVHRGRGEQAPDPGRRRAGRRRRRGGGTAYGARELLQRQAAQARRAIGKPLGERAPDGRQALQEEARRAGGPARARRLDRRRPRRGPGQAHPRQPAGARHRLQRGTLGAARTAAVVGSESSMLAAQLAVPAARRTAPTWP